MACWIDNVYGIFSGLEGSALKIEAQGIVVAKSSTGNGFDETRLSGTMNSDADLVLVACHRYRAESCQLEQEKYGTVRRYYRGP